MRKIGPFHHDHAGTHAAPATRRVATSSSRVTAPTIAILAAGTATRFGRPKQLEPVAADGAVLLDYALYDAHRAGFRDALVLTRGPLRDRLERHVTERFARAMILRFAEQVEEDVANSTPPGTGHAALRAAQEIGAPFALVNADDFYGPECYTSLFGFLATVGDGDRAPIARACVVGFDLAKTMHGDAGASRAVCEPTADRLWGITEFRDVRRRGGDFVGVGPAGPQRIDRAAIVSMNGWGFSPNIGDVLARGYARFRRHADTPEFLLSTAVNRAIAAQELDVTLLRSSDEAFGLTHPGDVEIVRAHVAARTARGEYPAVVRKGES